MDENEKEIELARINQQYKLAFNRQATDTSNAFLATVVAFAQSALKAAMLINGGAAVAVLAFIGNVWKQESGLAANIPDSMIYSLVFFSIGVITGAIASGGTYLAQFFYHASYVYKIIQENKYSEDKDNNNIRGIAFHIVSLILVAISYLSFAIGIYMAYLTFSGRSFSC